MPVDPDKRRMRELKRAVKKRGNKHRRRELKKTLADNGKVRWTIVFVHRPLWNSAKSNWGEVEKTLGARPYTVFCGHLHRFQKYVRNGRNYYQLATTGGVSRLRGVERGEFDEIAWVTMKADGPVLAHVMLDSVFREDLRSIESAEGGVAAKREATQPVHGRVFFEGTPTPGAAALIAAMARQTRLSGLRASRPSSDLASACVNGKSAMQGMPSPSASFAALPMRSTESRATPGIEGTASSTPVPAQTKSGQIRSFGESHVSRTIRRDQSDWRRRRMRRAGKEAVTIGFFALAELAEICHVQYHAVQGSPP